MIVRSGGVFKYPFPSPARDCEVIAKLWAIRTIAEDGIVVQDRKIADQTIVMEREKIQEELRVVAKDFAIGYRGTAIAADLTEKIMNTIPIGEDTQRRMSLVLGLVPKKRNVRKVQ